MNALKILTYAAIDEKLGHGSRHAGARDQGCVAKMKGLSK
jgi:hypothetical protein